MKPSRLLNAAVLLPFLNSGLVFGQDEITKVAPVSPFSKGNTFYNMSNDLRFSWKKLSTDDVSQGNRNRFGLMLEATYFLIDNFGIGAGISSEKTREKDDGYDEVEARTLGSINAMYGCPLGGMYNIYGKASFRAGQNKYSYEYQGFSEESKYQEFGMKFEVGAPITVKPNSGLLITPFIAYDYGVSKDDNYKDATSSIYLGTRLNFSLPCASYAHGCDDINRFSENKYSKGRSVLGGSTYLSLNLGSENDKYIGDGSYDYATKYSIFGAKIIADYYYYVIDNLSVGGELRLRGSSDKNKDDDSKESSFSWMLMPQVLGNIPVEGNLNNTFVFVGYGFGMEKDKFTDEESEESNYNNTDLTFGLGYYFFLTDGLALTPIVDYSMFTQKDTDTDIKSKRNGMEANISLRYTF
jgi:hypothetical protein